MTPFTQLSQSLLKKALLFMLVLAPQLSAAKHPDSTDHTETQKAEEKAHALFDEKDVATKMFAAAERGDWSEAHKHFESLYHHKTGQEFSTAFFTPLTLNLTTQEFKDIRNGKPLSPTSGAKLMMNIERVLKDEYSRAGSVYHNRVAKSIYTTIIEKRFTPQLNMDGCNFIIAPVSNDTVRNIVAETAGLSPSKIRFSNDQKKDNLLRLQLGWALNYCAGVDPYLDKWGRGDRLSAASTWRALELMQLVNPQDPLVLPLRQALGARAVPQAASITAEHYSNPESTRSVYDYAEITTYLNLATRQELPGLVGQATEYKWSREIGLALLKEVNTENIASQDLIPFYFKTAKKWLKDPKSSGLSEEALTYLSAHVSDMEALGYGRQGKGPSASKATP